MKPFDLGSIKKYANLRRTDKKWQVIAVALIAGAFASGVSSGGVGFNVSFSVDTDLEFYEEIWPFLWVMLCVAAVAVVVAMFVTVFLGNVLTVGTSGWMHRHYRGQSPRFVEAFSGFSRYWPTVGIMALRELKVALWSLLFVVPGVIAALRYSMVPYILADNQCNGREMSASEVLHLSDRMTDGHKGHLFVLELSFIGWQILSVFTFGILGALYVNPYYLLTLAGAYEWLRAEAIRDGLLPPDPEEPPTATQGAQTTRFCTRCGAPANVADGFCTHCGNPIV